MQLPNSKHDHPDPEECFRRCEQPPFVNCYHMSNHPGLPHFLGITAKMPWMLILGLVPDPVKLGKWIFLPKADFIDSHNKGQLSKAAGPSDSKASYTSPHRSLSQSPGRPLSTFLSTFRPIAPASTPQVPHLPF